MQAWLFKKINRKPVFQELANDISIRPTQKKQMEMDNGTCEGEKGKKSPYKTVENEATNLSRVNDHDFRC